MTRSRNLYLGAIFLAALVLHAHTALTMWDKQGTTPSAFALGALAWSLLPYVVCYIAARVTMHIGPAGTAATLILLIDTAVYLSTLSATDGQTGLVFVFMPLWNLIIIVPATILIGEVTVRRKLRASSAP